MTNKRSHRVLYRLALLTFMSFHQSARAATIYDAVKDFSIKSNPNGVWTYMDYNPLPNAHRSYENVAGIYNWTNDLPFPNTLTIAKNTTGQTVTFDNGAVTLPPGYLLMDAQACQPGAIVQFQAPVAGLYVVKGSFLGLAEPEMHNNFVFIAENGIESGQTLFDAKVGTGKNRKFSLSVTLMAGDTLQFYTTSNARKGLNDVGLNAKITGP